MTTSYALGWLPTPEDVKYNTYIGPLRMNTLSLPETLDLRPFLPPIRDQGKQGSCVAQAGACLKEWQERKEIGYTKQLSPQFIYNLRLDQHEEGMYFYDLMNILAKYGVCQEGLFPYGTVGKIPALAFEDALNFKIKTSARIPKGADISVVKSALTLNGPCVISFTVYNFSSRFWIQRPGDIPKGGHAVAIVGYTADSFILRNSWGSDWGDRGYTYFSFENFLDGKYMEIWTTVDDKSHVVPPSTRCPCCGACDII